MHNKVKAIFVGNVHPKQMEPISLAFDVEYYENGFEVVHFPSDKNIVHDLYGHSDFDVIVTFADMASSNEADWWEWCQKMWPTLSSLGRTVIDKWIVVDRRISPEDLGEQILNKFFNNARNYRTYPGMVSITTPCYKTKREWFFRMYESLKNQTYQNWEWVILDDSGESSKLIESYLDEIRDFRIRSVKNLTHRGNVGYNKRVLGMMAQGEYILELDHDDELTHDCLEHVVSAFESYPDAGFVYSEALELLGDNLACLFENGWAWGQGKQSQDTFMGFQYNITPDINSVSIRTLMACPNHVRVWRKTVYDKINGHNHNFSIVDDFEIMVRTFLVSKFCYIPKVLYIQHREHETTQVSRNAEIQRCNLLVKELYDYRIHERILELGEEDLVWDNTRGCSDIQIEELLNQKFNYVYEPEKI